MKQFKPELLVNKTVNKYSMLNQLLHQMLLAYAITRNNSINISYEVTQVHKLHLGWFFLAVETPPPPGGGESSQKNQVGVCSPLPKTLTLFMTKICNIPYPIYDLTKNSKPYL